MNFREILIRLIAMTTPYIYDQNVSLLELVRKLYAIVNELCIVVQGLKDDYDDLKNYVDNYFKNLNLSSEVKSVIDEMVADGTLANLINQELLGSINTEIVNIKSELVTVNNNINDINTNISAIKEDITGLKDYDNANNSNIVKLKNKQIVQVASCEANSNYVINNVDLVADVNDILYIHFNQAIDNTKQATLTINGVAKNVIKDDGSLFLGSDLENTDLILKVGEAGLYQIVDIASLQENVNKNNTEINTLNTLYENLQADVTNNTDGIQSLADYLHFNRKLHYRHNQITSTNPTISDQSFIDCDFNKDGSAGKIYGFLNITAGATQGNLVIADCGLRPKQDIIIKNIVNIVTNNVIWYGNLTVKPTGNCTLSMQNLGSNNVTAVIQPCTIFCNEYYSEDVI